MRKIGELKNEKDALNLWSYLKTENIETTLEKEEDKSWSIWVSEEDKVKVAQKELSEFVANPENKKPPHQYQGLLPPIHHFPY